jgi:hypothetical protein
MERSVGHFILGIDDLAGLFGVRCFQLGLFQFEILESKSGTQSEATVRRGEARSGREREEGGSRSAGFGPEAVPDRVGNPLQFTSGSQVEIEEDEREIAIAEEEVGALDCLHRFPATDPEDALAFFRAVGCRIKGIVTIDEREGEIS